MKPFLLRIRRGRKGFSLVESTLSFGIITCGIVTLAPMLEVGFKSARQTRDDITAPSIVRTLTEEARQGTLCAGTLCANDDGRTCAPSAGATYNVQATVESLPGSLSRLTLQVTPVGDPKRVRLYAVVYPTAPTP
jgi:hypothetical protein